MEKKPFIWNDMQITKNKSLVLLKSSLKFWQYTTNERNGQGHLIIICNTYPFTGFLKTTDQTTIYQPTTVQQEIWGPENCLTYILHKLRFWKLKHQILAIILCSVSCTHVKGSAEFVQKVTFEPLKGFKQNHYWSWKYYKNCYF